MHELAKFLSRKFYLFAGRILPSPSHQAERKQNRNAEIMRAALAEKIWHFMISPKAFHGKSGLYPLINFFPLWLIQTSLVARFLLLLRKASQKNSINNNIKTNQSHKTRFLQCRGKKKEKKSFFAFAKQVLPLHHKTTKIKRKKNFKSDSHELWVLLVLLFRFSFPFPRRVA